VSELVVDGTRIAYRVDGRADGPPLLLINSLGTDLRMWDAQVGPLGQDLRVIRFDCRGHGRSSPSGEPVTLERLGRDALALLDHLRVERAHVCGLSLGGVIALWLAAHHGERVDRAVFANTAARIGTAEGWGARIEALRAGGMAAMRDTVVARFLGPAFRARHPATARLIGDMLEHTDPATYIGACEALRDTDLGSVVASIRAPSLIVAGALDEATPVRQAEELHAAIADSQLAVLAGASHLSNVECAEEFTARVRRFLALRKGSEL
jgi:3-oxoadipate enol-lactonase